MEQTEAAWIERQDRHQKAWPLSTTVLCLRPLVPACKRWLLNLKEFFKPVYIGLVA